MALDGGVAAGELPAQFRESYLPATQADLDAVYALTAREREWYQHVGVYETADDVLAAYEAGRLVQVSPDEIFRPNVRFTQPERVRSYPPFVSPDAAAMLALMGGMVREELDSMGISRDVRIPLTSFVRPLERQRQLTDDPTKLAVDESTHTKAGAVDADASSYVLDDGERLVSVSLRDPAFLRARQEALRKVGQLTVEVEARGPEHFDERIPKTVLKVVDAMHEWGFINRVLEYPDSANQCLHLAVRPGLSAERV